MRDDAVLGRASEALFVILLQTLVGWSASISTQLAASSDAQCWMNHLWTEQVLLLLLLLLLQMSWITVLRHHTVAGHFTKSKYKTMTQLNADVC